MTDPAQAADTSVLDIVGKFLDWPFLLFVLALILAKKSGATIVDLIAKRKFEIEIGGNKLTVGDALEALEEETTRDLKELSERIAALEARGESGLEAGERAAPSSHEDVAGGGAPSKSTDEVVFQRMLSALEDSKFRWRTIDRLAIVAGVSVEKAHEILAAHQEKEIVLGRAKSGAKIVRLSSR